MIEFLVQSSLPYILLLMVCAHYCTSYPNDYVYDIRPTCVVHTVWSHFIPEPSMSRLSMVDFIFIFSFHFILFLFLFFFYFLFLEQLGLGSISHKLMAKSQDWSRDLENEVEDSGTKWHYTAWTTHTGLMLYSWSFRVGCTVVSMDHG